MQFQRDVTVQFPREAVQEPLIRWQRLLTLQILAQLKSTSAKSLSDCKAFGMETKGTYGHGWHFYHPHFHLRVTQPDDPIPHQGWKLNSPLLLVFSWQPPAEPDS